VPAEEGSTRMVRPADISVLPVKSLSIAAGKAPFAEQVTVRIGVRGNISQVAAFLEEVNSEGYFLPVGHILIEKYGAERTLRNQRLDQVKATIFCNAFLITKSREELLGAITEAAPIDQPTWRPGF